MTEWRARTIASWALVFVIILASHAIAGTANASDTIDEHLIAAARFGDLPRVRELLKRGADPNARLADGNTVLTLAAHRGIFQLVKLLVEYGADVNARRNDGDTSLFLSACCRPKRYRDISKLLLDSGADVHATNNRGETTLMRAASEGRLELVRMLLDRGALVNATDTHGRTPLMWAARAWPSEQAEAVELLVCAGADVNGRDEDGRTAAEYASQRRHKDIVAILKGAEQRRGDCTEADLTRSRERRRARYPATPAGVVDAFVKAALEDLTPALAEQMGLCDVFDLVSLQDAYLPDEDDVLADKQTHVIDAPTGWGPNVNKVHIATSFVIKDVAQRENTATVKVAYARLGWMWDAPIRISQCRSLSSSDPHGDSKPKSLIEALMKVDAKRKGWTWDTQGCRFLYITNDTHEVTYRLAKPGRFWRIVNDYRPHISVHSAIRALKCTMIHRPRVTKYPTQQQRRQIEDAINVLQHYLGE